MSLSHEDVQRLLQLLDASQFDELQLETDGTKLLLRRRGAGGCSPVAEPVVHASPATQARAEVPRAAPAAPVPAAAAATGLLDVRASMLGAFYGAPKPGAAPFVSVGDRVQADTVVGIIEVMKLMNSIAAGVSGEVVEVLVRDGDLVEYEQVLLRVRPL